MATILPDNFRGPVLDLTLPASASALDLRLHNKTTEKTLAINLPAGWPGDDLSLDWFRRTITDQTGADRSALLDPEDNDLWTAGGAFVAGSNNVELEALAGPVAYSKFTTESGAITGDTLSDGSHTWQGAGDSDDFTGAAGAATRTAVSDGSIFLSPESGRVATVKSLSLAAVRAEVEFEATGDSQINHMLFVRYKDISNFLAIMIGSGFVVVRKRVAGAGTTLEAPSAVLPAKGEDCLLRAEVTKAGAYTVSLGEPGAIPSVIASGSDSALAAAGSLATGTAGFGDLREGAVALTRTYRNFRVRDMTAVAYGAKATLRADRGFY